MPILKRKRKHDITRSKGLLATVKARKQASREECGVIQGHQQTAFISRAAQGFLTQRLQGAAVLYTRYCRISSKKGDL